MQDIALSILKKGESTFITGSAGTGKTHLLREFVFYLKARKITPTVVAPTAIAASHLQGQTIHSFFSLGIRDSVDSHYIESLLEKKYLKARFSKLKVLIIDEISMVSPEIFSSIDKITRAFKKSNAAFGGIQVILSGDFFQLPPISKVQKDRRFAWQSPSWRELDLKTCYLEKKFRQDDDLLISVLDEIRSASISSRSYEILNSRDHRDLDIDFKPTKLYTHNIDVDRINNDELEKLSSTPHTFAYKSEGSSRNIEKIFRSSLLMEELTLKKDAVVIFIKNNHEKGYINGTTGVVVGFDKETTLPIVKSSDGAVIVVDYEDWSMENESGKIVAKVSQIPLKLAWAITIHKSQGMTLGAAEIDLSKTFEVGQGYVALSRIKNIEGLRLMGLNERALCVDPLISHIDDRIKAASKRASSEILDIPTQKLDELFVEYMERIGGLSDREEIEKQEELLKSDKLPIKSTSIPTHLETKEMIERSSTLEDLAKNRGLSKGTIIKHLSTLKELDPDIDLDRFMPDEKTRLLVKDVALKIREQNNKEDFTEDGQLRLKPIYEALEKSVEYDDIRMALC